MAKPAPVFDRDAVLALIRAHDGDYGKREIARDLRLDADQKVELKKLLRDLEAEGAVERRGRHAFFATDAMPKVGVVEIIDRDTDGELLARLARAREGAQPVIRLAPGEASGGKRGGPALGVGDRALVRLAPDDEGGYEARVIKRLGQSAHRILCVVRGTRFEAVDRKAKQSLRLRPQDQAEVEDGQLVLVALDGGRNRQGEKTAKLLEVVGRADEARAATLIALTEHGIAMGFSDAEEAEAGAAKPIASLKGREDLRQTPLVTIDPSDARDHDDAVWAAPDDDPKNKGGWVVIVAIADVAAYVKPGSALDRGAEERGNSVYFPDRVVPMLPEKLSADLCSLKEKQDRACLAVRMVFTADGAKRSHKFTRAMMRSAARLTYQQAQAAIDGQPDDATGPLLTPVLKPLWAAYAALSKARARRAPLDIDSPERKVVIDAEGKVVEVKKRERLDAHRLIEEFMIQANVCAAETLEAKRTPLVYRIHDTPSKEKIEALADFLPQVGLSWAKGQAPTPARFNELLAKAKSGEHADVVNEVVLRSQSQAVYSTENIGHFGLNLAHYAHFTSPIRRYADLIVHRGLIRALGLGDDGLRDEQAARLVTLAERISAAERRAMAAERDATDRYLSAFLADRVGSVFEARITGVTRWGAFVKLAETGADGLVPARRLGDEFFRHDPRLHALVGERSGARYRLGQLVEVRLVEATPVQGGLLFDIETPPEPGKTRGAPKVGSGKKHKAAKAKRGRRKAKAR